MHILIIPSGYFVVPTHPLGCIFQFHQANVLHSAGYQIGVIAPGVITSRFVFRRFDYAGFEETNGYPVYRHYVRKFMPQRWALPARSILFYQDLGLSLYQSYKKQFGKPDVVHAHNVQFAGFVAQAIRELDAVPYIITEHSDVWMRRVLRSEWLLLCSEVIRKASASTAVSRALVGTIREQVGEQDIEVLHNVFDPAIGVHLEKHQAGTRVSDFVFLNIACLDANKDQTSLIEAFALHFKGKRARLRIGGTGPLFYRLKRLARRLGVDTQVDFLGYLEREVVFHEMQTADCFVLSSHVETFGVVLIEALACGTPVIATRCGGPDEIVNEENGLLVAPGDVVALGGAMVHMFQTEGRYRREVLQEECRIRFGKEAFIANATRYYAKAMEVS